MYNSMTTNCGDPRCQRPDCQRIPRDNIVRPGLYSTSSMLPYSWMNPANPGHLSQQPMPLQSLPQQHQGLAHSSYGEPNEWLRRFHQPQPPQNMFNHLYQGYHYDPHQTVPAYTQSYQHLLSQNYIHSQLSQSMIPPTSSTTQIIPESHSVYKINSSDHPNCDQQTSPLDMRIKKEPAKFVEKKPLAKQRASVTRPKKSEKNRFPSKDRKASKAPKLAERPIWNPYTVEPRHVRFPLPYTPPETNARVKTEKGLNSKTYNCEAFTPPQKNAAAVRPHSPEFPQPLPNHKKFQYKCWTDGLTTESYSGNTPNKQDTKEGAPPERKIKCTDKNGMVHEIRLTPFISEEQARERVYHLGVHEAQGEIDAFGAVIMTGNQFRESQNEQASQLQRVDADVLHNQ